MGLEGCGGSLFVDEAVVIDVPLSANCNWQIQTDKDRVLVFTVVQGGNFKQVEEFLSVRI
jgi:C-type lectin domain family 10 protein A